MSKFFLFISLIAFHTLLSMEVYFTVDTKDIQHYSSTDLYALLEKFLDSSEGKNIALRPPGNVFAFPSRHTYILHLAIALNDLPKIKSLFQTYGIQIAAGFQHENRTFKYAVEQGNQDIISYLKKIGVAKFFADEMV